MPWNAITVQSDPTADHVNRLSTVNVQCHGILFQALPGNSGRIVFGSETDIVATTPAGHILVMLPPPLTNTYPSASAGIPWSPAAMDLNQIYWAVSSGGDGFICSFLT